MMEVCPSALTPPKARGLSICPAGIGWANTIRLCRSVLVVLCERWVIIRSLGLYYNFA